MDVNHPWIIHTLMFLVGGGASSWLSFMAQTFPVPEGKYARWFLLGVQKLLANTVKAEELSRAISASSAKESPKSV